MICLRDIYKVLSIDTEGSQCFHLAEIKFVWSENLDIDKFEISDPKPIEVLVERLNAFTFAYKVFAQVLPVNGY